ncbi:MAG: Glutathione S-transferase domain protein [Rhizobium sp.]|nr:Glutathione S-transferase domain protein [Rhizobium sp.]
MKLYNFTLSGHSHRARLFLSLLGVDCQIIDVDLAERAHKSPEFLRLNVLGQVPVLEDDGVVIADSNAILVYLAKKFGRTDWLPEDARSAAEVQRWLSVAAGQLAHGPAQARLITVFNAPYRPEEVIPRAHAILEVLNQELSKRDWIAGGSAPSIADVALYSYVARAPEGNVDLGGYPHILAWLGRVESLPGFVEFPSASAVRAA